MLGLGLYWLGLDLESCAVVGVVVEFWLIFGDIVTGISDVRVLLLLNVIRLVPSGVSDFKSLVLMRSFNDNELKNASRHAITNNNLILVVGFITEFCR